MKSSLHNRVPWQRLEWQIFQSLCKHSTTVLPSHLSPVTNTRLLLLVLLFLLYNLYVYYIALYVTVYTRMSTVTVI